MSSYSLLQSLRRITLFIALFGFLLLPHPRIQAKTFHQDDTQLPQRTAVVIELQTPPAAHVYAALRTADTVHAAAVAAATRAHLAQIEEEQQQVVAALATVDAPLLYRVQRVYNGVAARLTPEQIAHVRAWPSVKAVHPLVRKQVNNSSSIPHIGAPVLWSNQTIRPVTGQGMTIAIIDTGVDYLHVNFGGPGGGYAQNDLARTGDTPFFPSAKIIGGFDFTGDTYNADPDDPSYQPIPQPDTDPMDCNGHGTHVAGTAAGFGTTSEGQTYRGSYAATTAVEFTIGPGVAPEALIYALKVFGCSGSSDVVDQAIEWAVDPNGDGDFADHVDVINMSLGSFYGAAYDSTAIAAENAAQIGVIVVASAGNSYDTHYVVGSPSVADRVISVAATLYSPENEVDDVASFSSRGPRRGDSFLKPDVAAPGSRIVSAQSGSGNGVRTLSGTSMAAPHVSGAMLLLRQLYPDWSVEELKALIVNTAGHTIRAGGILTGTPYSPVRIGAGGVDLVNAIRSQVVAYNADDPGVVSVSFGTPEVLVNSSALKNVRVFNKSTTPITYTITYVSSADVPGVDFVLPDDQVSVPPFGSVTFPVLMRAEAAKMRQLQDATLTGSRGFAHSGLSEEVGYIQLWPLLAGESAMAGSPFSAQLMSIQNTGTSRLHSPNEVGGRAAFTYGPQSRHLRYSIQLSSTVSSTVTGVSLRSSPFTGRGSTHTMWTTTAAEAAPLTGTVVLSAYESELLLSGNLYLFLTSTDAPNGAFQGQVQAMQPVLSVPIYAAPRAVSDLQPEPIAIDFRDGHLREQVLTLRGQEIYGSSDYPTSTLSLMSAFELHYNSPNQSPLGAQIRVPDLYDHADLRHIGVTSNFSASVSATQTITELTEAITKTTIFLGIATHANWSTPNDVSINVLFDIDGDGASDYRLFNSDEENYRNKYRVSDGFITVLENLKTGDRTPQQELNVVPAAHFDVAIFNTNVMVLPVHAAQLGLSAQATAFSYFVESHSRDTALLIDSSPTMHYDIARPTLSVVGSRLAWGETDTNIPIYAAANNTSLTVKPGPGFPSITTTKGLLLLFHHNRGDNRATTLSVQGLTHHQHFLPWVSR